MKIAIVGRPRDTLRYESYLGTQAVQAFTTLSVCRLPDCSGVLLPGGGDITPAFFGEHNKGSRNIDTELDIIQLQAVRYCICRGIPLLGICKGMQVINVALGGTVIQDLPTAHLHKYTGKDQHHSSRISPGTFLWKLYGESMTVNSAHHQGVGILGDHLCAIQWCPEDQCVEAIVHETLPIIGLQWHPERLDPSLTGIDSLPLLSYFLSLCRDFSGNNLTK